MNAFRRTPYALLAALVCCGSGLSSTSRSSAAQGGAPLVVEITLLRQQYMQEEEIPILIRVTNVSPAPGIVRVPEGLGSLSFQVVDTRTNQPPPVHVQSSRLGGQLQLRYRESPAGSTDPAAPKPQPAVKPPECHPGEDADDLPALGPDASVPASQAPAGTPAKPKTQAAPPELPRTLDTLLGSASRIPITSPLTALLAGASARTDFELLELYGSIAPGSYSVRAVYATDGLPIIASGWSRFTVVPLSKMEAEARGYYMAIGNTTREEGIQRGRRFLKRFPNSMFTRSALHEIMWSAYLTKDWPTVVQIGEYLYARPLWHGEQEAAGISLGAALWHLGRQEEAAALLLSLHRGSSTALLHRLQNGEDN